MIHVLAIITTKPGKRADVLAAFHRNIPNVHAEAGCIEYGPVVDAEGLGRWRSGPIHSWWSRNGPAPRRSTCTAEGGAHGRLCRRGQGHDRAARRAYHAPGVRVSAGRRGVSLRRRSAGRRPGPGPKVFCFFLFTKGAILFASQRSQNASISGVWNAAKCCMIVSNGQSHQAMRASRAAISREKRSGSAGPARRRRWCRVRHPWRPRRPPRAPRHRPRSRPAARSRHGRSTHRCRSPPGHLA